MRAGAQTFGPHAGASDDMFILKGVNIFPVQVEQVLMNIPEVGNNYVIVLRQENNIDNMIVRVEVNDKILWKI
jgi:phenylacetate-CoA ligase